MGEQISNADVNPIIVLILGIMSFPGFFFGALFTFLNVYVLMKCGTNRAIGCTVWSLIPIFSLVINIDNWKVAQKLGVGETLDEMHHELEFLNALPLLSPR